MLLILFSLYIGFGCIQTLADWKRGPFFMVLAVALQDPIRKMTPGTPGWLVLSTVPILMCMLMALRAALPTFHMIFLDSFPQVKKAAMFFLITLIPAALLDLQYGIIGIMMLMLASLIYGIMLVSPLVGFFFGHDDGLLERFFKFYVLVTTVMLTGGVLEFFNVFPSWLAVGTEAMNMDWIRHIPGFQIKLYAGFYRSPDVYGWHATMMTMLAFTLFVQSDSVRMRVFWLMLSGWGLIGAILCGRRKFLYMLPVFGAMWLFINRQKVGKCWFRILILSVVVLVTGVFLWQRMGFSEGMTLYYTRAENLSEIEERANAHGINAVIGTFQQTGWLGQGLGCAQQGLNHLARRANIRVWQEGGLSRFAVEFGLPGLIGFLWLAFAVLRELWYSALPLARATFDFNAFGVGIAAILAGTAASFVVSGQIFNDPFVMFFTVFLLGVVLSTESRCLMIVQANPLGHADEQGYHSPETVGTTV
jgi:hypothetical protein